MATHSSIPCLEHSMDRGAWQAAVCGIAKSRMRLNTHAHAERHKNRLSSRAVLGNILRTKDGGFGAALQLDTTSQLLVLRLDISTEGNDLVPFD